MSALDDQRLRVVPGDGVVARAAGVVAVAFPDGADHGAFVNELMTALHGVAGQDDTGRRAARAVAGLLAAAESPPPLGVVGADGNGLAVLLHGDVEFAAAGGETLTGADAATWLDRLLETTPAQWSLARTGAGAADEWSDLQSGVARGDGLAAGGATAMTPTSAPARAVEAPVTAEPEPEAEAVPPTIPAPTVAEVVPPPPDAPVEPTPAADFVAVSLLEPADVADEPAREPLPVVGSEDAAPAAEPEEPEAPMVRGVRCSRGHLNDPASAFCAVCGISMVQQTHNLVEGPRPPLGVLVLDDGSTYVVDRDLLIGREPSNDEAGAGMVRLVTLPDPERAISRVHARITLHEWEARIEDAGSANGTFVAARDATQWTPVPPGQPVTLVPGMHVLVGQRVLSFDSHRRG